MAKSVRKIHFKNSDVGGKQIDFIFLHQSKSTMPLACSITMYVGILYLFRQGGVIQQEIVAA